VPYSRADWVRACDECDSKWPLGNIEYIHGCLQYHVALVIGSDFSLVCVKN